MNSRFKLALTAISLMVGCKQTETSSQSASVAEANGLTEQCGVVKKNGPDFVFISKTGVQRNIEPQDGATTNILSDSATRAEEVCLRADWSGSGDVLIVSTTAIRIPIKKTLITEQCGILMQDPSGKIVLQIANNNSEMNGNRELDAQDGATDNLLKDFAKNMSQVCVKGDFTNATAAVMVKSQSDIRKSN